MFTLVRIVSGEFDSDWHRTFDAAAAHAVHCKLGADWYVTELTAEQVAQVYAYE